MLDGGTTITVDPGATGVPVAPVMPVEPAVPVALVSVDGAGIPEPLVVVPGAPAPTVVVELELMTGGGVVDPVVDAGAVSAVLAAGIVTTASFFWQAVSASVPSNAVIKIIFFMLLPFVDGIGRT